MDPISIIVAAVIAGAASGAQGVASEGIADAYRSLKALLRLRFGRGSETDRAVDEIEGSPESGEVALRAALADASADRDDELVALARQLLERRTSVVENVEHVGEYAALTDSAMDIDLVAEPEGTVRQERRIGRGATVNQSGQSIRIGGASHPPREA